MTFSGNLFCHARRLPGLRQQTGRSGIQVPGMGIKKLDPRLKLAGMTEGESTPIEIATFQAFAGNSQ
jgi:hypothetical protein